jgi:hypothetical protein
VQFLDGVSVLGTVPLTNGNAYLVVSTLPLGTRSLTAAYGGDATFDPSASQPVHQRVLPPQTITAVEDVAHDEGREVRLRFLPNGFDALGSSVPILRYDVFRQIDVSPDASARSKSVSPLGSLAPSETRPALPAETMLSGWDAVASVGAYGESEYSVVVPTLADSDATGFHYSAFLVRAATAQPTVYFDSAPDSGYSLDNLPPPTPAPFAAVYGPPSTALHWGPNSARDFYEFRLYRGLDTDFVPGFANLVTATRDTGYVDATPTVYVYKLSAVDIHGNESHFAVVTPNGPVATLASLVAIDAQPNRIRLTWFSANPGLAATVYRRTANSDWASLGQITVDGTGYLRYQDSAVQTGTRYGYRLGIMDGGTEVFVGEAWATAEPPALALEGARPNPAVGGALAVAFTLSSAEAAKLELIDVTGRRLVARDVGSLGPGAHSVNLGEGTRIPPGIYLVRLSAAEQRLTRRVVALP